MFLIDQVIRNNLELKQQNQFQILVWLKIMGSHVDRKFIVYMIQSYDLDRKSHHFYCCCFKCKPLSNLLNELDRWIFNGLNKGHNKWFMIFHKTFDSKITLFPVFV